MEEIDNICMAEYIWIDANMNLRSKTKILQVPEEIDYPESYPIWNYDGASTGQAEGKRSDIIIKPVKVYPDPFRGGYPNVLILTDTWKPDGTPHETNTRIKLVKTLEKLKFEDKKEPEFGFEQEFFITKEKKPLGLFLKKNIDLLDQQGDYYCGIGADHIYGRKIVEEALHFCNLAGLSVSGMNSQVAPGQWEIQIHDIDIEASDQIYFLRYILKRVAEKNGCDIDFSPKPMKGEWNGSGCHTNFSTYEMRQEGGYDHIINALKKLSKKHKEHMSVYGKDNQERLTGNSETSNFNDFTYGVADRTASIRIPLIVHKNKKGYLEDRRPASNMDPYLVSNIMLTTILL